MLDNINKLKLFGDIQIGLTKKTKNLIILQYKLNWEFRVYKNLGENNLCSGANFNNDINGSNLIMIFFWNQNKTSDQFKNDLIKFIKGNNSNEFIRHEVKHFLDIIVDDTIKKSHS